MAYNLENFEAWPSGSILARLASSPELYLVQPSSTAANPQPVHRLDGSTTVTHITEVLFNSFQVTVTNRIRFGPSGCAQQQLLTACHFSHVVMLIEKE